jgi:hypothetical protein
VISADVMLKIIVGHFWGDRDDYMTTGLPGINSCIPDRVIVSDYGSSPRGGNFRLKECVSLHLQFQPSGVNSASTQLTTIRILTIDINKVRHEVSHQYRNPTLKIHLPSQKGKTMINQKEQRTDK